MLGHACAMLAPIADIIMPQHAANQSRNLCCKSTGVQLAQTQDVFVPQSMCMCQVLSAYPKSQTGMCTVPWAHNRGQLEVAVQLSDGVYISVLAVQ